MQPTLKHENVLHDLINQVGSLAAVELLQDFFDLSIFFLNILQGLLDSLQAGFLIRFVRSAGLIFHLSKVLDFCAAVFDFGKTKSG
jgi:hypothetical protein